MQYRTDLALEAAQQWAGSLPPDARQREETVGAVTLHCLTLGEQSAAQLGRAAGEYVTAQLPPLTDNEQQLEEMARTVAQELTRLLPPSGTVLVVGLGNEAITPDALGPRAARMVLATRHIRGELARSAGLDDLRPVAVLSPGVLGHTGMESGELTAGACACVQPSAVIAVDALAAGSLSRLGCTVQLSNTGIAPGSGVGNNRRPLDEKLLGVPVIGIGVPTVVDASTLARELTGQDGGETVSPRGAAMMVTPREVDLMIARASRLVAMIVNAALQPEYSPLELCAAAV
ncbi:MAG: GPR endopeptidase [Clostridia bacterium]|nr:GPR endopeptidase [Clostridia bacterium]